MDQPEALQVGDMLEGAREALSVQRVFGEPIERDGVVVLPVAKVIGGGGGGSGTAPTGQAGTGSGGGFGLAARPAGVYLIRDGTVEWRPAVDPERLAVAGMVVGAIVVWAIRSVLRSWARR